MNIDINLLPEEVRPKPLIDTRTFGLIVLILILAFACVYVFMMKSDAQSDIATMETSIATMQREIASLSSNAEAIQLTKSNQDLTAAKQNYNAFVAGKILWGDALEGVYKLRPKGVSIAQITQDGNTLRVAGTADSYTEVSSFARALHNDPRFTLAGLPTLIESQTYTLVISVAPGGAQ